MPLQASQDGELGVQMGSTRLGLVMQAECTGSMQPSGLQ